MSESNGSAAPPTEPVRVRPGGSTAIEPGAVPPVPPATAPVPVPDETPGTPDGPEAPDGVHPTGPVTARPAVRARRPGPLTQMGPWAPVAGAVLGLLFGLVAAAVLAGTADDFRERLSLVFLVVGLSMLGASGTLLADEVRLVRRGAREAAIRPAWVETTAGLLSGLTPARLLLAASAFVLFLAAYVSRG